METGKAGGVQKRRRRNKAALIRRAIENIEEKIEANDVKASIGDFIRLLQLEKELEPDRPRAVKVTWVEQQADAPASEE